MEEMMISTNTRSPSNQSSKSPPPWKLYENPLYTHHSPVQLPPLSIYNCNSSSEITLIMEEELEEARAQLIELKAELEFEHRLRKKMECLANRMAKELEEERMGREAVERVCEELGNRVSSHQAEIDRIVKEMDEERKMLRVAEVFREERLQMKLTDAKIFYEEKLLREMKSGDEEKPENVGGRGSGFVSPVIGSRRVSPEPENPHIKRGIKGSVEFQRVIRALYTTNKSNRHLGGNFKLECQKAQLKILLKQRSPIRPNSLVMS